MSLAEIVLLVALPLTTIYIAARAAVPATRANRTVPTKVLLRALFPSRIIRSRSGRTDTVFFLFNKLAFSSMLGWAIVSVGLVAQLAKAVLDGLFGALPAADISPLAGQLTLTVAIFLASEFAYWLNHWMSHRFAVLWAFHKVHHSAESLSILTNYRVHPIDTIVYFNMNVIITGLAAATTSYFLGAEVNPWLVGGTNAFLYITTWLLSHLQHSHLWISFPGRLGRLLLSPAHHQIHHSVDRRHHNRNFGSTLAIFDWMFGTLFVPTAKREKLVLGIDDQDVDPHSFHGALVMPFIEAAQAMPRPSRAGPPATGKAA